MRHILETIPMYETISNNPKFIRILEIHDESQYANFGRDRFESKIFLTSKISSFFNKTIVIIWDPLKLLPEWFQRRMNESNQLVVYVKRYEEGVTWQSSPPNA